MEPNHQLEYLLECLIQVIGRVAVPIEAVHITIRKGAKQIPKQFEAYNLCDGTRTLTEVASESGLDQGNFSRTFQRWVENGIAYRIGKGADARPLHIYPIPKVDQPSLRKSNKSGH